MAMEKIVTFFTASTKSAIIFLNFISESPKGYLNKRYVVFLLYVYINIEVSHISANAPKFQCVMKILYLPRQTNRSGIREG